MEAVEKIDPEILWKKKFHRFYLASAFNFAVTSKLSLSVIYEGRQITDASKLKFK
jgi:hypothetical protein